MRSIEISADEGRVATQRLERLVQRLAAAAGAAARRWRSCAACGAPTDSSRLCEACRSASGFGDRWRRRHLGDDATALPVYALGLYRHLDDGSTSPSAALLWRFKYGGDRSAGRVLVRALADSPHLPLAVGTNLVPVPLHPQRLRRRGFNQAAWFARSLARRNHRPLLPDAIVCAVDTPSRAQMTRAERRDVSAALFRPGRRRGHGDVAVLVDDVCTTGTTLRSARATLEAVGFRVPFAVVLLSTERSGDALAGHARTEQE